MNNQVLGSLWPLFLSIFIGIAVYKFHIFHRVKPIPAGDILLVFESALNFLKNLAKQLHRFTNYYSGLHQHTEARMNSVRTVFFRKMGQIESSLVRWEISMFFIVIIIVIVGFLTSGNFT